MPVANSRHVALTEPLACFIDGQVAEGRYATTSEVVRVALRLLMKREEARAGAAEVARPKRGPTHG
jgi:antitoxin ParD1/3/4